MILMLLYIDAMNARLDGFTDNFKVVAEGVVEKVDADKKVATEKLKGINTLAAFPTTFIIDRKGEVREIYTGYTGTVTGSYYENYVTKFNQLLNELIAEPNPYAKAAAPLARSE